MDFVALRPHHVARLIESKDDVNRFVPALRSFGYSAQTIDAVVETFSSLLKDPQQVLEITENEDVRRDSICSRCLYNVEGQCTLPGASEIENHNSADLRESASYGLRPGTYKVADLLKKKAGFHPKLRI